MAGFQVSSSGNHCVADRAASDLPALFIDFRAAPGMNGSVGSGAFVEPPMSGRHDSVGVLVGDVADYQPKPGLSDQGFHGTYESTAEAAGLSRGGSCFCFDVDLFG